MTKVLTDKTDIPNWILSIILVSCISVAGLGWTKVDNLEKRLIVHETSGKFEKEKLDAIENKLDEVLEKIYSMEKAK